MSKRSITPTVSVIIPAYNAARWIADTLESVFTQTYRDFEVIFVDDGSTDHTSEVVANYRDRILYLYKKNGGSSSARNAGIQAAHGSYIAFLDADDLWLPEKLEKQMQALLAAPELAWVYSDAINFEDQNPQAAYRISRYITLYTGDILRPLLLCDFISSATPIIKSEVFDQVGYFDESLSFSEDWDMWLRIAARYPVQLVAEPLAMHRLHAQSKTESKFFERIFRNKLTLIEHAVARSPHRVTDLRERAIANVHLNTGAWMLKAGCCGIARQKFGRAINLYPWHIQNFIYWLATFCPRTFLNYGLRVRKHFRRLLCQ